MFKKMFLFMFIIVSFMFLLGCNSETLTPPEDVRNEIWEVSNNIYNELTSYISEEKDYSEINTNELSKLLYDKYYRDESLTTKEKLLIDQLISLATQTRMLSEGYSFEDLKNNFSYDYELELEIAKQLLGR